MGHGYNHYVECNCPWCVSHGRGKVLKQQLLIAFEKRLKEFKEYFSTTNPNAKCKFCGETIFFYQNSYGSRVFFDKLGKPWPKHKCYYETVQEYFEDEIALTLDNLPDLFTDIIEVKTDIIQINPKIKERLLNGHIVIEWNNDLDNSNSEYIIKYNKIQFGLCFFNEKENTLEGYLDDENYSLKCYTYEIARIELKEIFPYEVGEDTIIEIFKENVNKDIIIVYYNYTVKNYPKRPEAFMKISTLKQDTLNKLYRADGLKIKVKSKMHNGNKIEFTESE